MRHKKYTEQQLKEAVANNCSLRGVLIQLGVAQAGGNYEVLHKAINHYSLDTSHFTGQAHMKGKTYTYRLRSLEAVLTYGKLENNHKLRLRLVKSGMKEYRCECCRLDEWLGSLISLELHHIDGDKRNNRLNNLKLLCPNCHAKTGNYRGKNKKSVETRRAQPVVTPMVKA